jgi:prevent-host-death family protein
MNKVGIRELSQNASAVIKRVAGGETVEVTERGRPVARIVPLQAAGPLAQMFAEGRVTPGKGDLLAIEPLPAIPGTPTLSSVLEEMRADER